MGDELLESLVRQAVTTIRERYEEPLSLDDLARAATMSKFHFLRTFRNVTGVTPIRFVSAVRINEAKRLLSATQAPVAEISVQVGYGSLRTFTRRFTECVGMSPTSYRRMSQGVIEDMIEDGHPWNPGHQLGSLSGTVRSTRDTISPVFVGVFETRVPRGRPVVSTIIAEPGPWRLPHVPAGTWHLLVAATAAAPPAGTDPAERPLLVATANSVRVLAGMPARVDVTLRPLDWLYPPLMVALPGVEAQQVAA